MACRRRQRSLPDHCGRRVPSNMDHLAFKYMEMCKVESSTDSDSEISPRWSDTSTMGCVSSAPESGTLRRTLPLKPAARHGYSLFLDPYDGSSEDSDESNVDVGVAKRTKQQGKGGGCRFSGRSRRFLLHHPASVALREVMKTGMREHITEQQHLLDAHVKGEGSSEVWVCEIDTLPSHSDKDVCRDLRVEMADESAMHTQTMDVELQLDDSGLQATISSTPHTSGPLLSVGGSSFWLLGSSSEKSPSPCHLHSIYKRKLGLPGVDVVELGQRKRQCVVSMEAEREAADSASEPRLTMDLTAINE